MHLVLLVLEIVSLGNYYRFRNKDTLKDLSQMTPYASFLKDAFLEWLFVRIKIRIIVWIIIKQICSGFKKMLIEAKKFGHWFMLAGCVSNEERYLALNQYFKLPKGIVPMWMISFGYIDQEEL